MIFSREMIHVGLLEDSTLINLEAGDVDSPIVGKTLPDVYVNRHNDPHFAAFQELYARAPQSHKPCPKAPCDLSLYDFASMFDIKWQPLLRYKVVCPHPSFESSPNPVSNPQWYRRFLLSIIRLHDPRVGSLEDLDMFTTNELRDDIIETLINEDKLPPWVEDLINNDRVPPRPEQTSLVTAEEDQVPDVVDEDDPHQGLLHHLEDEFADTEGGADEEHDFDSADATEFDKSEDKNNFVPFWTASTAEQLRSRYRLDGPEDLNIVEPALQRSDLNEQQAEALDYLLFLFQRVRQDPSQHFLAEIIGAAGTGKTTLIKCLKADIAATLGPDDPAIGELIRFAAPTGCAAKLLPSPYSTLHSLLHLPVAKSSDKLEPLSETTLKQVQEELKHLVLLVIDEKSFLGAKMFSIISQRMQQIFCQGETPFGGISVLMMGDFAQLSPVSDTPLYSTRKQANIHVMAGLHLFQGFTHTIILTQLQRQATDVEFKELLHQYVTGTVNDAGYAILAQRHMDNLPSEEQAIFNNEAILLCAYKKDYTKWNKEKIRGVGTPRILVQSLNNPESCSVLDASSAGGLPRNIVLCRGMKVMLTANLCLSQGLANGSTGEVVAIVYITPEDPFPTVLVQFKDYTGQSCLPHLEQVYPVGIITRTWTARKKNQSRTMLPLLPGYALSIHKSQGQTLDKVLVDLGASEFSSGLTYTALTRVRSLASLAMRCMPPKKRFDTIAKSVGFKEMKIEEARKIVMEQKRKETYRQDLILAAGGETGSPSPMEVD